MATSFRNTKNRQIIIPTVVILIRNKQGDFVSCRALLDSGSLLNFISAHLAKSSKLPLIKVKAPISGIKTRIKSVFCNFTAVLSLNYGELTFRTV